VSGATLTASYSGVNTTYAPQEAGFRYGTSQGSLTQTAYYDGSITNASGSYSATLMSLASGTTYYYQAYMTVWDGSKYVDIVGSVKSFKTTAPAAVGNGYLECIEVPAITNLSGTGGSGSEASGRGYKWFRYNTSNSKQAIATHTFENGGKVIRNYTVMLDGDKKCALWSAHAMHADMWKDNGVGRNDGWTTDPAFDSSWQQTGVSGYSKGHLVASNYRQTTTAQNKATFYYSNQAPQYQTKFNDGVWNQMENKIKAAAPSGSDTLYVVTGVLYEGTAKYVSSVQIPSHFYACIMKCSFNGSHEVTAASGTAYVFTNEAQTAELNSFKTTIDAIETRAGFDFFPKVPSDLQTKAENGTNVLTL